MKRALMSVLAFCACGAPDRDGDGLTNEAEAALGTDPEDADSDDDGLRDGEEVSASTDPLRADTDGDRLSDGAEVNLGTNPLLVDSDADTYEDEWEFSAGTDPLDYDSRIYRGFWPYNPPGSDPKPTKIPRDGTFVDQFGDDLDLLDFGNHGKFVVVDLTATWMPTCRNVAKWLDGEAGYYDAIGPDVVKAIDAGDVYWISVLTEMDDGSAPFGDDADSWSDDYQHGPERPIVADTEQEFYNTDLAPAWFPYVLLFDEHLKPVTEDGYVETAIAALQATL